MKMIKYNLNGLPAVMEWSESNEEMARRVSIDEEPVVYECEPPESDEKIEPTTEERLAALESAMLEMILGGMTE